MALKGKGLVNTEMQNVTAVTLQSLTVSMDAKAP